ncbi:MAG: hypothetical protein LBI45_03955 [Bacteroidales bacterium]|jgi:uncharacterized membrane protein YjgN (DUF898 family)|nr:hypothetical protein [Bacteroidales bacterium]
MKEINLFSEQQKFRQIWVWIMLLTLLCIPAYTLWGTIRQLRNDIPFGNNPTSNIGVIIVFIIILISVLLPFILVLTMKLETIISKEGINFRFFPFHLNFRNYKWEKISKAFVRNYSPLGEFGGWGIKYSYRTGIRLFNISGNQGLQIELKNGKKILIGTQKMNELEVVLKKIEQMNKENQSKII